MRSPSTPTRPPPRGSTPSVGASTPLGDAEPTRATRTFASSYNCGADPIGPAGERACLGGGATAEIANAGHPTVTVIVDGEPVTAELDLEQGTRLELDRPGANPRPDVRARCPSLAVAVEPMPKKHPESERRGDGGRYIRITSRVDGCDRATAITLGAAEPERLERFGLRGLATLPVVVGRDTGVASDGRLTPSAW